MRENQRKQSMDNDAQLRAAKNTALLIIMRIVMPLISIALVLVISRFLGVEGMGRFTLAYSFLTLFNSLGPLGLNPVVTREGTRSRFTLESILGNSITLCTLSATVLTFVMIGTGIVANYDSDTRSAIIFLSLAIIPCTIGMLLDGAAVAIERVDQIAMGMIVEYVVKVGAGVALLFLGYGLDAVLLMAVVGKALACVVQAALLKKTGVSVRWSADRPTIRMLLGLAPTFLGISIFGTLYWRIDVFMLSSLRPVEDVGYYGAAYRILELAMVFPQSFCLSLYPQITTAIYRDPSLQSIDTLGRTTLRYLMVVSVPMAVCATVLAKPTLGLLYGQAFEKASTTLSILIFTLVPYCVVRYHAYVIVGANRQRIDLYLNIVMGAINVLLNLWLIPRYAHMGAAAATLIAISVYAVLQWVYLRRRLPGYAAVMPLHSSLLIVTALTGSAVWLLRAEPIAIPIAAGCVVYVVSLIVSGFFTRTELHLLRLDRVLAKLGILRT